MRVLVVEDNRQVSRQVKESLEQELTITWPNHSSLKMSLDSSTLGGVQAELVLPSV